MHFKLIKPKIKAYIELTKPRILTLVLVTTLIGYYLGGKGINSYMELFFLLLGAGCVCAGASTLNHYLEREFDSKMLRTENRPLPKGVIKPNYALNFGIIITLLGLTILYIEINILTAFLSLLTTFLYVLVYTPMKRVSWMNTTIGSIPGAIPPLGGWAAATGSLNFDAGILFLIMFLWQHPHFYAIAWMCREDYSRGGFKMLPCVEPDGESTFRQTVLFALLLIPVSIVPTVTGISGKIYFLGALSSGLILLYICQRFKKTHTIADARNVLKATVFYLPILLTLIVLDSTF